MNSFMHFSVGEKYKLKITSKRLSSGNYQVKFVMKAFDEVESFYGYLLVKPRTTLKDAVQTIENQLDNFFNPFSIAPGNYSITQSFSSDSICMIFKSKEN